MPEPTTTQAPDAPGVPDAGFKAAVLRLLREGRDIWAHLPTWKAMGVLLVPILVFMWSLLLLDLSQRQADIRRQNEDRMYNVAQISAQALNGLLLAADQMLKELRYEWNHDPVRFLQLVEEHRQSLMAGTDFHISVIGPDGRVRFSSLNSAAIGLDTSQSQHFTQTRDNEVDRVFINGPFFTQKAQRWLMPLSRRLLPDANGHFAGTIVFWVSPEFVTRIYKTARVKPGSIFTVVDLTSGQILLRHRKTDAQLEPAAPDPNEFIEAQNLARVQSLSNDGAGRWRSGIDQIERIYGWQKSSTLPFALLAGEPSFHQDKDQALQRWRYLGTGGGVTLLLMIGSLGLLTNLRWRTEAARQQARQLAALQKQQTALENSRENLRQLGQHLARVREDERQRIAQDIHDELGQRLTVMRMHAAQLAQQLAPRPAPDGLAGAPDGSAPDAASPQSCALALKAHMDDAIAVLREIAEDLRPGALSVGLGPAIESLCDEFNASLGLNCQANIDLVPTAAIATETATVAYRILQESLTNVMRHAHSTQLDIDLYSQGDWLHLLIRDNGTGFDPDAPHPNTFGLLGMRERAHAIGGSVTVQSHKDQGTWVVARLPLQPLSFSVQAGAFRQPLASE